MKVRIKVNEREYRVKVTIKIEGKWRLDSYSGVLSIEDTKVKIKVGLRSILKGLGSREGFSIEILKAFPNISIEGPLSLDLKRFIR